MIFFFSSRRRHTRCSRDWSSDVCSSDLISTNATPPWNENDRSFEILGRPSDQQRSARLNYVNSEYFSVLHIPLLAGRLWDRPELMRGARLCVVNQDRKSTRLNSSHGYISY